MDSIRLGELSVSQLEHCLRGAGLTVQIGTFRCLIRSDTGHLAQPLHLLYQDYSACTSVQGFYDFRLVLKKKQRGPWGSKEVEFEWGGSSPFPALPITQTHPLFEWGLNWCVATLSGSHTVIHSAVVERDGGALVLPGAPGSGKSTLCAALALAEWRLLSDELTILSQTDGWVQAIPRPISLKGTSIELIQAYCPLVDMTPPVTDTRKGTIAYARPPVAAVASSERSVPIAYVVFPKFKGNTELVFEPLSRATALTELMDNTFNVGLMGSEGFTALARSIAQAKCYAVEYGDLSSILEWVDSTCRHPA